MRPPIRSRASTTTTRRPRSASVRAAASPAAPAPMTKTSVSTVSYKPYVYLNISNPARSSFARSVDNAFILHDSGISAPPPNDNGRNQNDYGQPSHKHYHEFRQCIFFDHPAGDSFQKRLNGRNRRDR